MRFGRRIDTCDGCCQLFNIGCDTSRERKLYSASIRDLHTPYADFRLLNTWKSASKLVRRPWCPGDGLRRIGSVSRNRASIGNPSLGILGAHRLVRGGVMTGLRTRKLTLFRGSEGTESGRQLLKETVRSQSVRGVSSSNGRSGLRPLLHIEIVRLQRLAERQVNWISPKQRIGTSQK